MYKIFKKSVNYYFEGTLDVEDFADVYRRGKEEIEEGKSLTLENSFFVIGEDILNLLCKVFKYSKSVIWNDITERPEYILGLKCIVTDDTTPVIRLALSYTEGDILDTFMKSANSHFGNNQTFMNVLKSIERKVRITEEAI